MTKVVFYSNVADKLNTLAGFVQQALQKRQQVTLLTESEAAAVSLSGRLWEHGAIEFVPNVLATHALASQTPVVIHWLAQGKQASPLFQDDILINLTSEQPGAFSRFRVLVELVGHQEEDKLAARTRYKFYRDRGYEIKHIDQQNLTN